MNFSSVEKTNQGECCYFDRMERDCTLSILIMKNAKAEPPLFLGDEDFAFGLLNKVA